MQGEDLPGRTYPFIKECLDHYSRCHTVRKLLLGMRPREEMDARRMVAISHFIGNSRKALLLAFMVREILCSDFVGVVQAAAMQFAHQLARKISGNGHP